MPVMPPPRRTFLLLAVVPFLEASALADGSNPYHLEGNLVSPFDYLGTVTSTAPPRRVRWRHRL